MNIECPSESKLIDAFHCRLTFKNRPVTMIFVLVILLWYFVEIAVVLLGWDINRFQWMFTTESFPQLSPGLSLAIISHALPPRITHLLGNVAALWILGGESEQHMSSLELAAFFLMTSQASVLAGTALTGENTLGASGGVMALLGFYCTHLLVTHRDRYDFEALGGESVSLSTYRGVILVLTPVVFLPYLSGQAVGFIPSGRSDAVGHLTGFVCGICYAALRDLYRRN